MECEVIVVGGGIGGLAVAALLAARGCDVALFERQSHVGGCVARFEHLGHSFDPTFGLFAAWEPGGVWENIFADLPVAPPHVTKLSPNFVVRLPNGTDVPVSSERETLEQNIARAFPECADKAAQFLRGALGSNVDLGLLESTSDNFRAFIDAQLSFLSQSSIDHAEPSRCTDTLKLTTGDLWSIDGGAHSLADCLADSFKQSGGTLRLNSPVLRLAYAEDGTPNGVDLLSGERVTATRAIVSNLTVWDTYGKLVGLKRTPPGIAKQLRQMSGMGIYQILMSIDDATVARLPDRRIIFASGVQRELVPAHMMLNIEPVTAQSPSSAKRCATLTAFTDVDEWFAFHEDSTWHEEKDQAMLEEVWRRLHAAAPEIGDAAEVFETITPQTTYDSLRRRMGTIGAPTPAFVDSSTEFGNVFLVGDTVAHDAGLAGVAKAAQHLAAALFR